MCDTGNATGFPVINLGTSPASTSNSYARRSFNKHTDINVFANSTYLFTVQAKQWQSGSGFVYGPRHGVNFTTEEGEFLGGIRWKSHNHSDRFKHFLY